LALLLAGIAAYSSVTSNSTQDCARSVASGKLVWMANRRAEQLTPEQRELRHQLKAEWKQRHAKRQRRNRIFCQKCGVECADYQLPAHKKSFWHKECDNVLRMLSEGRSQTEVAASYVHGKQWLQNYLKRTAYYKRRVNRRSAT
jgi:hypothetical protein